MINCKKRAFSLIELSIVVLIIAVIMSVVAGSIKMVTSARLTNARALTLESPVPKIPGLVAWYETSRLESFEPSETTDGAQISTWHDVSPGSITKKYNSLTKINQSDVITYKLDGIGKLPSVYFVGNGNLNLNRFYQGNTTQNTIFVVAKPLSTNPGAVIDSACGFGISRITLSGGTSVQVLLQGMMLASFPNSLSGPTDRVIVNYFNNDKSRIYLNNAATPATNNSSIGSIGLNGLQVGGDCINTYFNGLISEVIIYNRPLSSQERRGVLSYINQKYEIKITGI